MPGFGDYIFIFLLALVLFGPKKMPELARQLGKLMGEFRKASNEFKMQMEEELRVTERAEQEKKVAALQAATPAITCDGDAAAVAASAAAKAATAETPAIAAAGELTMRPPETGLPVPQAAAAEAAEAAPEQTSQPANAPAASSADAVNALAESVPAAHQGQTIHD